ncbi:MAG: cation acetate symporter [Armatimonadetes bacterium]|nr:cation acetate symporter [Armatimonadota bacterium]
MNYETSPIAIATFAAFVAFSLWIAVYLARRAKTAHGYYAADGSIHWAVNGLAFAGDYLSAASFLGICGMIATAGYDGFLYSIGYLAGWIVALFVVAEPVKRLGRYTFADALNSRFNARSVQFTAAISTLVVSLFYLIPQMVGAGSLVTPLLGIPHTFGVVLVGGIVIFIVATAGMASTTYVQFLKGGLLILFSTILAGAVLLRGISTTPSGSDLVSMPFHLDTSGNLRIDRPGYSVVPGQENSELVRKGYIKVRHDGAISVWKVSQTSNTLEETLTVTTRPDGSKLYNGAPLSAGKFHQVGQASKIIQNGRSVAQTGALGPLEFLSVLQRSTVIRWDKETIADGDNQIAIYFQKPTPGSDVMRPGLKFKVDKGASSTDRLNFVSLMLALFCGTAALPHILIRYYTVPDVAAARKSTIVAISAIGFFYILTLFMGLGAMVSGVIDVTDNNMSAPLLARSFGTFLFACISAIAFATVLGTVSGLIVAASGAVAHDLIDRFFGGTVSDSGRVVAGKLAAVAVGVVAIFLGIRYEGMNVSYLVGWAFAVAASANLPALVMLLFWKRTTAAGISASIVAGLAISVALILLSPTMYESVYHLSADAAPIGLDSPAIIAMPLSFVTLVAVSLLTQPVQTVSEVTEATTA